MPIVIIKRDPKVIDDQRMKEISRRLSAVIAEAFDISEHEETRMLTANNVRVHVLDSSDLDLNMKPLEITILVNYHPIIEKTLAVRRGKITEAVRMMKPLRARGWVLVLLVPGSFEEF